ncbi:MAG: glutamate-1-semialdehyde 2,1-aminomutase [Verrucomicrobia bacterium]|nr:glutamate-1-semialdehyde 2,1-aminomutase [Verrucomicrobiota bacterium]MCF7709330.1 glutamate-1-semialdehyde 2,1-aminomutase [Verrucomicrobiota bacterium]
MKARTKSDELFAEAVKYIPGGVNSPVRALRAVGGRSFFVDRAAGSHFTDIDGNDYIDYLGTWGPAIHGHAYPPIIEAVKNTAENGTSFGIPNPLEVKMAKLICDAIPSVEKVRMCNSGTEATMSAVRLARGFTGRNKIIKFAGCYHGHVDSLLVKAGSGALTFGQPTSAGVPPDFAKHTIVLPFNDIDAVRLAFAKHRDSIAGIILEPIPANSGLYLPHPGYLESLRQITKANDALLIFDEVMTGFRIGLGGAQQLYGVEPDLSCFGKIIGGGLPVGAFGGKADIMDALSPDGPVYQAGTLSGNPVAMAAGIAALEGLLDGKAYEKLEGLGAQLEEGMNKIARSSPVPFRCNRIGSMFCTYFVDRPVYSLDDAAHSDKERFGRYFRGMLEEGVYLAPSQFEAGFISTAHTEDDIEKTVAAAAKVLNSF